MPCFGIHKSEGEAESTINFNCLSNQEVAKSETLEEYDPPAEDLTVALLQNLVIVCCTVSLQLLHNTLYVRIWPYCSSMDM